MNEFNDEEKGSITCPHCGKAIKVPVQSSDDHEKEISKIAMAGC